MRAAVLTVRALALLASHDAMSDPVRLKTTREAGLREIEDMRTNAGAAIDLLDQAQYPQERDRA